ncbi:MAG TPA: hypothetical protein VFA78_00315, partial [Chloroflexota bacterium]|nr:hypothetical protein [Chloroflexota bacterium]
LASSAFVFFFFLGLQAGLIHLLPYRYWKRVSVWIQLTSLFVVLFGFFLVPAISAPGVLTSPANRSVIAAVPSFWFLGLYQAMLGTPDPVIHWLARRALIALAACLSIALSGYLLGYGRHVRKTIEESGAIADTRRASRQWAKRLLDLLIVRDPCQRAVFWFVCRTMFRNRVPRLILAAYASIGIVYVIDGLSGALKNIGRSHVLIEPNAAMSAFPLILPFFLLLGMRVLFAFPVEVRANWAFRIIGEGDPVIPLRAVRKLMIVAGIAPVCLFSLPMYGLLWGWWVAIRHVALSALITGILLQLLTTGFYKIPFTCTFMPGKSNLKGWFTVYVVGFLIAAFCIIHLELWLATDVSRAVKGVVIFAAILALATWRRRRDETGVAARLIYEERANWQLNTLELT